MKKPTFSLLFCFIVLLTSNEFGQAVSKGVHVTPRFSAKAVKFDKIKIWQAKAKFTADVSMGSEGKLILNGDYLWAEQGFPWYSQFLVKEYKRNDKKPGRILLDNGAQLVEMTIPVGVDFESAMKTFLYVGDPDSFTETEDFKAAERRELARIFSRGLSVVPFETQRALAKVFKYSDNFVSPATFKDKTYLSIKVPTTVVYNTIQVNQAERAARVTQEALGPLKSLGQVTGKVDGIEGIKFETVIYSKDFLRQRYSDPDEESYEMYLSFDLLKKFADADITNQDLIDGSVVLINGSRVKVNLTSFS